jgi:hypothetical protein
MHSSSRQTCEWCKQASMVTPQKMRCGHSICDKCILNDKKCQSACPCCWYMNGTRFTQENKICSGK